MDVDGESEGAVADVVTDEKVTEPPEKPNENNWVGEGVLRAILFIS